MATSDRIYTDQLPGRTLVIDGATHLFCSGTSYLGIARSEQFREHLLEGIYKYGANYSSSRNSNLQLRVYDEAEAYLAAYTGAEAALTMSSGYLAGQALVQLLGESGHFRYAPGTHPALWRSMADAPAASLTHDEWVYQLLQEAHAVPGGPLVIVCNSLDPLKAVKYDFDWVAALPAGKQVILVLDDSHGIGVTGTDGAGIFGQLRHLPAHVRLVVVGSLGKALGIPAGVVLGDAQLIAQLRATSYFGGASPAVPAYLYAFLRSEKLFAEARARLYVNIEYFRERLARPELFSFFDRYPVFSTRQSQLYPFLMAHRILISSFRYPTPADAPITRVILSSLHTSEDLQRLATRINQFEAEAGDD